MQLAPDITGREIIESASGEVHRYQRRSMRGSTGARVPVVFFSISAGMNPRMAAIIGVFQILWLDAEENL
jgi:hypothetical protein